MAVPTYHVLAKFTVVALSIQLGFSAHILVLLPPVYSIVKTIIPAIEELNSKYEHKTTIVTNTAVANRFEQAKFKVITTHMLEKFNIEESVEKLVEYSTKRKTIAYVNQVRNIHSSLSNAFLLDIDLAEKLKKGSFDIAITWKGQVGVFFNIIPYQLSIPLISFGVFQDPLFERTPFSPAFIPHPFVPFSDKMSFTERLSNTLIYLFEFIMPDMITPPNALQNYAPDKPYISTVELARNAELHLLDFDPLLDFSRPLFPNFIYVGGMAMKPAKPLGGALKTFMNNCLNGVVIVSFGSVIKRFSTDIVNRMMHAFHKLHKFKFVFKYGKEVVQKENVYLMPWIPQNDLLGHPNTKAFITHCGNSGQFEALFHGVPMIGIPVCNDQFSNAKRMETKGFGFTLNLKYLRSDDIVQAINNITTNTKIKTAIKTASEIFRTRPQSQKEKAAYWIDHVIKYGGQYMRPANLDMPFYQYILLDITLFLASVILTIAFVAKVSIIRMYHFFFGRKIKIE